MPSWLGGIFKDPDKRAILSWLGGGAVVVAGGIWTVITFVVEHKDAHDKKGGDTAITQSGQGTASGRDTTFQGPVTYGPSKEQIEQIQKPLTEQLGQKDAQIVTLTKLLLERNSSAASGPGAQQAVGAAVGSIAQGAEEGDHRLEKALSLLKENKIAEATQLLTDFAGDKEARAEKATAQAEKDRKAAAVAYRNLGAIAGLGDPKKGLEAYAKAVELDPDDRESLYWHGWLSLLAGHLPAAEMSLDQLLRLAAAAGINAGSTVPIFGLAD
jgi:tetratricopeptide (TPR) repeat protein